MKQQVYIITNKKTITMKVVKFGGTSVGSATRIKNVANLLMSDKEKKVVVLSAMSGTTNSLVEIAGQIKKGSMDMATALTKELAKKYDLVISELLSKNEFKEKASATIKNNFNQIFEIIDQNVFNSDKEKIILAQGELISTMLLHTYMSEIGLNAALIPALQFMRVDKMEEPDELYISENITRLIEQNANADMYITQGFICKDVTGKISNLQRGGSDYTASIIGGAINAEEIQIWTDIDGFHNNDPRYVENTKSIPHLSFDEAAELAYFGAKILHPSTIKPAQRANIPVRLKNTLSPDDFGSIITSECESTGIKAVAAKDNITAIRVKSDRMLMAYGFLRKVFDIFEHYKTPIDMISTSEVAVSLTIDCASNLDKIIEELNEIATVLIDSNQTIVCIVGNFISKEKGLAAKVLDALVDIPIRMISHGGSQHNISVLISTDHKKDALKALSASLFS